MKSSTTVRGVLATSIFDGRSLFLFGALVTSADPPDAIFSSSTIFLGRHRGLFEITVPDTVFSFAPPDDAGVTFVLASGDICMSSGCTCSSGYFA